MPMDAETRRSLISLQDDAGVLSLYVNADPKQEASQPPWAVRLEHGLKKLVEASDNHTRKLLVKRLDERSLDLERLVRPSSPGRGRALFVTLSDGRDFAVEMQNALTDRIALAPRAHLSPMIGAWAEGSPSGVVLVDGKGLRVVDYRFGIAEDVDDLEFVLDTGEWRRLQGPSKARSVGGGQSGQSSNSQTDLFDYKVAEHLQRFLAAAHTRLSEYVETYGWEFLVVTGEPDLVEATAKHLGKGSVKATVVPSKLVLGNFTAPQVGEAVAGELAEARRRRDDRRIEEFREKPSRKASGAEEVLNALLEKRVEKLYLERDTVWSGQTIAPGTVLAEQVALEDEDQSEAAAQAELGEQMIERAIATDAEVAVLAGNGGLPEGTGGVGAILRW